VVIYEKRPPGTKCIRRLKQGLVNYQAFLIKYAVICDLRRRIWIHHLLRQTDANHHLRHQMDGSLHPHLLLMDGIHRMKDLKEFAESFAPSFHHDYGPPAGDSGFEFPALYY
jgi:hypothetical protein